MTTHSLRLNVGNAVPSINSAVGKIKTVATQFLNRFKLLGDKLSPECLKRITPIAQQTAEAKDKNSPRPIGKRRID